MNEIDLIKYEKLASLGNEDAIYLLANHYQEKGNNVKAFSYLTRIVNTKNPTYLRKIGYFFEKGLAVDENKQEAFEYYLKSAELGDYISQYNVAICYLNGVGTEKNSELAHKFAIKSANQKYEKALILLANLYRTGTSCEKDLDKAMKCLEKCSSDDGDVVYLKSLILLDNAYVKQNPSLAIKLLEKGCLANNTKCLLLLSDVYHKGVSIGTDDSKSLSLLLKAAKNGSAVAMKRLSEYYTEGIGTTVNFDIAEFWKNEANKRK